MIPDRILALADSVRTPFYAYDLATIGRQLASLERIPIERKEIFFATMANDHPTVLSYVCDRGRGVFVNSPKHLRLTLQLGFEPRRITYASSNMTADEMRLCVKHRVRLVLDSISQIRLFTAAVGRAYDIGVRVNVGLVKDRKRLCRDLSYRFGLFPTELPEAVAVARSGGVKIVGAHAYLGTDVGDPRPLLKGLQALCAAAEELPDLSYVDPAGGFAVSDRDGMPAFDVDKYGAEAAVILRRLEARRGHGVQLLLEPGRYLCAESGFFFVSVVDIKERSDRLFVGTDGSVAIFPRPLIYPDRPAHPCELVGSAPPREPCALPIFVCGSSTYSKDILAANVRLPRPRIGDLLVFRNAGAYCRSMITEFLGKERPQEIAVSEAGVLPEPRPPAPIAEPAVLAEAGGLAS